MSVNRIFFDFGFTGHHQNTTPISLGCIADTGASFYATFIDYDKSQMDTWLEENVIANLQLKKWPLQSPVTVNGDKNTIKRELEQWLTSFPQIEMWGDTLAYDWVLFLELFGGAFQIPSQVYYIPFDLSTLLKIAGIDPDISRSSLSGLVNYQQHNALFDALAVKTIVEEFPTFPSWSDEAGDN